MPWETIATQPLVQIFAVLFLIVGLERAGFDAWGSVRSFLRIPDPNRQQSQATPQDTSVFTQLLSRMDELSGYYNHDTTEHHKEVLGSIYSVHEDVKRTNTKIDEIQRYGVKQLKD
jgi:hypothetical protein